jgi:hypothetical protein
MPTADSFLDARSADSFLDEGSSAPTDQPYNTTEADILGGMSERERKRIELLSQQAAAQQEARSIDRRLEGFDFLEGGLASPQAARMALEVGGGGFLPEGVKQSLSQTGSGLTSPLNLAMLGVGGGAGAIPKIGGAVTRGIAGGFAVDMGRHIPEVAQAAGEASAVGTPEEKQKAYTDLATVLAMTGAAGRGAIGPIPTPKPPRIAEFPALTDPNIIAVNRMAPGTVGRAAERMEMAPPVVEPPPGIFEAGNVPFDRMRRFGGPLPPIEFIDMPSKVEAPRADLRAGGKVSFAAEAPVLLRNAVEQAESTGLTRSAEALKVSDRRAAPQERPAPEPVTATTPDAVVTQAPVADFSPVKTTENAWDFGRARQTPEGIAEIEAIKSGITQELATVKADKSLPPMERLTRMSDIATRSQLATEALQAAKNVTDRPAMTEYFSRQAPELNAPVMEAGAAPETVRLYRGQGDATAGGAFWSDNPTYARSFGDKVQVVDVPKAVAEAARAEFQKTGSGTPGAHILSPEWTKQAKPLEAAPEAKVTDLTPESTGALSETAVAGRTELGNAPATAASIISKLESLKTDPGNAGKLFSLPHPDAIKSIAKQTWNDALDLAIGAVKAGRAIGEAVEIALQYLRKNVKGISESQIRDNLNYIVSNEAKPKAVTSQPAAAPEGQTMRKSAARATTAESVPEPVQQRIANAPESFYEPQSMADVQTQVKSMKDTDLATVRPDSDIYVASQLEAANRLFKAGDLDAGYKVFEALEKEGTSMGQNINQFKLLDGTTPAEISYVVNRTLKEKGRDALTPEQNQRLIDIAQAAKDRDGQLKAATEAWKANPTPENAKIADAALDASNAAALELQKFTARFQPRTTPAVLKSILQGNLLTPISQAANLIGNASFLPFRAGARGVSSVLDTVDSFLSGMPREISAQPIRGTAEAIKGAVRGAKTIPDILMRGSGDTIKGETRAGLHPIRAWVNQFSKNPEMPTVGGKLTFGDRVNLALEGTFGVPAEAMLRGLAAGDAPFREAAHARVIAEQLKLKGVPKDQWTFAQRFPELFFDRETMQRIGGDTAASVFQRESKSLSFLTKWLRGKGEWMDLAAATVAPYKLTPWNIIGEVLSFNPLVAWAKTGIEAKRGNTRLARLNAGKMVIGGAMTTAAAWLYNKGLIAPSLDEKDEAQKARVLSGQVMPPNHLNVSGLQRALKGEDPEFKEGDKTVDFFRSGGLAGSMMYMAANVGRQFEQQPDDKAQLFTSLLRQSTLEQARFGLNQSFLQGVEGFLTAIKDGNVDDYLRQWFSTVLSIPLPNSLAALSRATREYKPDFRAEDFSGQVENALRNRLGFAGLDDYLPLKRDFWGQPLRETPEGRNALFYQFFDVSKGRQITDDPATLELYRLWRKTADSKVIPSLVDKQITVANKTYPLNAEQQSKLAELIGTRRKEIVDGLVVNPNFHKLSDEQKVKMLDRAYREGMDYGKALFWREAGSALAPKEAKAGFTPSR